MVGTIQRQQAGFQADEGDGVRRAHGAAEHLARVGLQAARDVEREHRAGLRVGVIHELGVHAVDRPRQADSEQTVDDKIEVFFGRRVRRIREGDPEKLLL